MPVLDKVLQATKNLAAAAKNDPRFKKQAALKAELKKLEEREEPAEADVARMEQLNAELEKMEQSIVPKGNNQTLSGMAAAMVKEPVFSHQPREHQILQGPQGRAAGVSGRDEVAGTAVTERNLTLINAPFARRIMDHCVSLASNPRRQAILRAIAEHDNGWAEEDASPVMNPDTGEIVRCYR